MADAATIAIVGVAVVMAALTILMMAITVITRLVPGGKEVNEGGTPDESEAEGPDKSGVAAMAVAVALAMADEDATLTAIGSQSTAPGHHVSRWASAGRERLMRSRRTTGRKWVRAPR